MTDAPPPAGAAEHVFILARFGIEVSALPLPYIVAAFLALTLAAAAGLYAGQFGGWRAGTDVDLKLATRKEPLLPRQGQAPGRGAAWRCESRAAADDGAEALEKGQHRWVKGQLVKAPAR
ncbi:hypothetical protein M885DRAFT_626270 [Pelagophyceae sp. CCMP2097]|nr:hypothetical protein M885DRAFT_626270 [Pelagophyceae sp. CCMP2097]